MVISHSAPLSFFLLLLLKEELDDVVEVDQYQQQEDESEANVLKDVFHLVAQRTAYDGLDDEYHDVAAVKGRDGQYVHKGQSH